MTPTSFRQAINAVKNSREYATDPVLHAYIVDWERNGAVRNEGPGDFIVRLILFLSADRTRLIDKIMSELNAMKPLREEIRALITPVPEKPT